MAEEIVVVTSKNCPTCDVVKKLVENKSVKVVDVDTSEGAEILKRCQESGLDVSAVPDCLVIRDGKPRRCTETEQSNLLK